MGETYSCQRCGAAVGPDATQGLCPACLLQAGLGDSQAVTLPSGAGPGSGSAELDELGRLFPQLEILEFIGRGGMGVVYKARQRGLDRLVALKILPPQVDHDPGFRDRFVREARALARLSHPNIVAVYDFGQVEGRYYFLMEYVDGANLRRTLQAGHLTPLQAMAIVPQLCDALQFAHEEGIVHRDIKPENILLDRKGRVKIADFGLAKLLGASLQQDPYTLTSPRQVLGTPHYMAPEQFERPGTVDHRADIYSMGVVFYEMLTGGLPLGRFPVPSRKVQVDVRLDEVVLRTLEKEPEHRYQRAGDVKTELASLNAPPPINRPPTWNAASVPPRPGDAPPGPSRRVSPLAIGGLVVALIAPIIMPAFSILSTYEATYYSRGGIVTSPSEPTGLLMVATVLTIICAVVSCWLGISAIRQIRRSEGRLYGLPLALFDAMLYPALTVNSAIATALCALIDPPLQNAERIWLLLFLLTLGLDAWVFRNLLRRLTRPIAPLPPAIGSPKNYALRPRATAIGCFAGLGICVLLIGLVLVALAVPYFQAHRAEQVAATISREQGFISAQGYNDSGPPADSGAYRFQIRSPIGCKTTLWAELWRDGKLVRGPGFDTAFWVIPPAGQIFDGVVTFELAGGGPAGQVKAGWKVTGNAGSYTGDRLVADPFAGLPLRDSTWGVWSGQWSSRSGEPIQLLVLRGGKHELPASAQDMAQAGAADVEVRLFARFDPMITPNRNPRILFGETSTQSDGPRGGGGRSNVPMAPAALKRPQAPPAPPEDVLGLIRADASQQNGDLSSRQDFLFEVRSPINMKTTVWAEFWHDGARMPTPGFKALQAIIPPSGRPFDGTIDFQMSPTGNGRVLATWRIMGNIGSNVVSHEIEDPFNKCTVQDSTWGQKTGPWQPGPGKTVSVLVTRGGYHQLVGQADDSKSAGKADAELRLFIRFDPVSPEEMKRTSPFEEAENVPKREYTLPATSNPATGTAPSQSEPVP